MSGAAVQPDGDPDANAVRMTQIAWDLGHRDGDVVRIAYREPGDGVSHSVLYGPSLTDIVKSLCRNLRLAPADIDLERAGQPKKPDMAWVIVLRGTRIGWRAARVSGVAVGWLSIALDRVRASGWSPDLAAPSRHVPLQEVQA